MIRKSLQALAVFAGLVLLSSCTDRPVAGVESPAAGAARVIVDGARGGVPEFSWLPPTVSDVPVASGAFDAGALPRLSVEVCRLDANGTCAGPIVERITSNTQPASSRLELHADDEYYQAMWRSGASKVTAGETYRVSVLRNDIVLGTVDVALVQNTPALASVDTRRFTPLVKGQQFSIRFRLDKPDPRNYVRLNEVESNQGAPGDWVELYNAANVPLDVSGFVFRDNDDTHTYVIPNGTMIAAKGFLVLDESQFDFGLGANEQARLYAPGGVVLMDTYAWATHAATTYARCPDGTGAFGTSSIVTKGGVNDCDPLVRINEIESDGGSPGDWVELFNPNAVAVSVAGYVLRDNADTPGYVIVAGTTIAAGGRLVLDRAQFGFELDATDALRLFRANGTTLVDSYAWTADAATTFGRCPDGSGGIIATTVTTKGTANNCATPTTAVKINEVESNGGTPGDWVELHNSGNTAVDLSGYVFRDNDDTHTYVLAAGSIVAAGSYLVLDEAQFGFGLGAAESARLFGPGGVTVVDSYTWTAHAAITYGRCPNGVGAFAATTASTKGAANSCGTGGTSGTPTGPTFLAWPGDAAVSTADAGGLFNGNLSGLAYEASGTSAPGTLWAVRNGPGALYCLTWTGSLWSSDANNGWSAGKALRYPDGGGDVDAEGITVVGTSVYVSAERNNSANSVSRPSVLLYDGAAAGTTLIATREWNLTADLPTVGANLGLEGITFVPDSYLTARGFIDESKGVAYNPLDYPNHDGGLFLVAVEGTGTIYAYALNHTSGTFVKVAMIASGFAGVMELSFDRELNQLWAVCDDSCSGRAAVLKVDVAAGSSTLGRFVVTSRFERPSGMPNLNNEGFAFAAQSECVGGRKPAFWADDAETGGFAIRRATVSCLPF